LREDSQENISTFGREVNEVSVRKAPNEEMELLQAGRLREDLS